MCFFLCVQYMQYAPERLSKIIGLLNDGKWTLLADLKKSRGVKMRYFRYFIIQRQIKGKSDDLAEMRKPTLQS